MSSVLSATATTALERQHHRAEAVVETMLTIANSLEQGRRIDNSLLTEVTLFLRIFPDQCQTAEEDTLLFPALEAKCTPPDIGLIASLKNDHRNLAALTLEVVELAEECAAGHDSVKEGLASTLRRLATLYREHIWREDHLLLPLAEKILSPEELNALNQDFERIESLISSDDVAKRIAQHTQRCECGMGEVLI
ncbi:MAG: hemerythrin domain-containing protein [Bryobacteraceae bacterium]